MDRNTFVMVMAGCGLIAGVVDVRAQELATLDMRAAALSATGVNPPDGSSASPSGSSSSASTALEADGKPWKFVLAPYLWIPAVHGQVGSGPVTGTISATVGDTWNALWDNFKFAACLHLEATKDRWTVFADLLYMDLGNSVENLPVSVDYKQGIYELGGGYAVYAGALPGATSDSTVRVRLEPIAGVRVWTLDATVTDPRGSRGPNEAWVDGFAGVRGELQFNETFSLSGRVDAGTGMSNFTWNALAIFNISFNKNIGIFAGWRWISDDYQTGSGMDRFEFDMMLNGPFAGVKITF